MDNKDKKQLNIFKSVQISKENKEKYFKVERGGINLNNNKNNNSNTILCKKFDNNNQDTTNHIFITHKNNIITTTSSKKGNKQNNNGIFSTTNNRNKNSFSNTNKKAINTINIIDEKVIKAKLNLVHFESIKNLCNHLNQNFNQLIQNEKMVNINEYLSQMYQDLQILNRKIKLITNIQSFEINKEDYEILNILLNHLLYMNKILNNTISKNIVNIYTNFNNFCNNCNCSL
jgi:hypothetical protein